MPRKAPQPTNNGNGAPHDRNGFNRFNLQEDAFVSNALLMQRELLNQVLDDHHNIDEECGYPQTIDPTQYRFYFDREGIAEKVVKIWPRESWKVDPLIYETEEADETEWETAWETLEDKHGILAYLQRIDELSGIGHFGILLLGIGDGKSLMEPLDGVEEGTAPGEKAGMFLAPPVENAEEDDEGDEDEKPNSTLKKKAKDKEAKKPKKGKELLFLRAFDESLVTVSQNDTNLQSPRYGQPILYDIQLQDPTIPLAGGTGSTTVTAKVHWSRVIHVADNRMSSEIYGVPRMRPVFNRLVDLRRLYGGSAEMFWKGAFPGYAFEANPDLTDASLSAEDVKDQVYRYTSGLQRYFAMMGISVKSLSPQTADPSAHVNGQLQAISIALDVPQRILMGSERGELSSSQDSRAWNDRVMRRQRKYLTPYLIRPLIERLMAAGVLPTIEKFTVEWPDLNSSSEQEKADLAAKTMGVLASYVKDGVEQLVPPMEMFTGVLGMETDEAEAWLKAASKQIEDEESQTGKPMPKEQPPGEIPPGGQPPGGQPPPFGKGPPGGPGGNPPPGQPGQPGGGGMTVEGIVGKAPTANAFDSDKQRKWYFANQGGGPKKRASQAVGKTASLFGLSTPKVNFAETEDGRVFGEHGGDTVHLANVEKSKNLNETKTINFRVNPKVTDSEHVAAHEVIHQVYSANPYSPEMHGLAKEWVTRFKESNTTANAEKPLRKEAEAQTGQAASAAAFRQGVGKGGAKGKRAAGKRKKIADRRQRNRERIKQRTDDKRKRDDGGKFSSTGTGGGASGKPEKGQEQPGDVQAKMEGIRDGLSQAAELAASGDRAKLGEARGLVVKAQKDMRAGGLAQPQVQQVLKQLVGSAALAKMASLPSKPAKPKPAAKEPAAKTPAKEPTKNALEPNFDELRASLMDSLILNGGDPDEAELAANAFASAAQRKWFFANLGKKGGPAAKKGGGKGGIAGGKTASQQTAAEYEKTLRGDLQNWIDKGADNPEAAAAAQYLLSRSDNPADLALAKHVEEATDRESMLTVLGAQEAWYKSPDAAPMEWAGALALGAVDSIAPGVKTVKLTDNQIEAYKARVAFTQEHVKEKLGESFVLSRGVEKEYADKIKGYEIESRSLASWTTDSNAAAQFMDGGGALLSKSVKHTDVFAADLIGVKPEKHYIDDVGEIVLLHKTKTTKILDAQFADYDDDFVDNSGSAFDKSERAWWEFLHAKYNGKPTENAFASAAQRKWYFANQAKNMAADKGGKSGGGGAAVKSGPRKLTDDPELDTAEVNVRSLGTLPAESDVKLFGKELTHDEICSLASAPEGSSVTVLRGKDSMSFSTKGSGVESARSISRENGEVVMKNEYLTIDKTGTGLGTKLLARQVEAAGALGVKRIETHAAGNGNGIDGPEDKSEVGYAVWPRLGYNMKLTKEMKSAITEDVGGPLKDAYNRADSFHDLYAIPGGIEAWKLRGSSADMSFDPSPGSKSRAILSYYVDQKYQGEVTFNLRRFSSTQIDIDGGLRGLILALAGTIPDEDLAEDGRETVPHITVKYGLHTDDPADVAAVLAQQKPFVVRLGKTSIFPAAETQTQRGVPQFDVVKIAVESPELMRLNRRLSAALDHTDTHPKYQPHVTLAYVKPGMGERYADNDVLEGEEFLAESIMFSGVDDAREEIPLSGDK